MAWDTVEANANEPVINTAISDWETANSPTSIDQIDVVRVGRDRVTITIVYTA